MPFGDLRSLLQRPAGQDTWQELCALLDAYVKQGTELALWEQLIQYTQSSLTRWDPALCHAPQHWIEGLFVGRSPSQMLAARALSTRGRDVGDEQIFEMTVSPVIRNLTILEMGFPYRVGWRPERLDYGCIRELVTCPHLRQLSQLTLTGQHLLPDSFVSVLSRSNQFKHLKMVDFSHNDLNFLRDQDLLSQPSRLEGLTSLVLNNVNLNRQGLQALSRHDLGALTRFELEGNHNHLEDTDLLCLQRQGCWEMPRLKSLRLTQSQELASAFFEHLSSLDAPELSSFSLHFGYLTEHPRQLLSMLSGLAMTRRLESLELDNLKLMSLDSEQLSHFFRAEHVPRLRELSLLQSGLHLEHIPWLLSWFDTGAATRGLQTLDCSSNPMRLEWLEALVAAMEARYPAEEAGELRTIRIHETVINPADEPVQECIARARQCGFILDIDEPLHPYGDSLYPEDELEWED